MGKPGRLTDSDAATCFRHIAHFSITRSVSAVGSAGFTSSFPDETGLKQELLAEAELYTLMGGRPIFGGKRCSREDEGSTTAPKPGSRAGSGGRELGSPRTSAGCWQGITRYICRFGDSIVRVWPRYAWFIAYWRGVFPRCNRDRAESFPCACDRVARNFVNRLVRAR